MDLLETILRSAGFKEFHNEFKQNGIDSYSLKILNNQDLQLLGIEDEEKRLQLLKVINNLQIPSEKKISVNVDGAYTMLVLNNISFHLQKHFANLTYILKREDVDICDIKLTPAVECLESGINSMQTKLAAFEQKVLKIPKKRSRNKHLISFLIITSATLFIWCQYKLSK